MAQTPTRNAEPESAGGKGQSGSPRWYVQAILAASLAAVTGLVGVWYGHRLSAEQAEEERPFTVQEAAYESFLTATRRLATQLDIVISQLDSGSLEGFRGESGSREPLDLVGTLDELSASWSRVELVGSRAASDRASDVIDTGTTLSAELNKLVETLSALEASGVSLDDVGQLGGDWNVTMSTARALRHDFGDAEARFAVQARDDLGFPVH